MVTGEEELVIVVEAGGAELAELVLGDEDGTKDINELEAAHDAQVAIREMAQRGVTIDEIENKEALGMFPKVCYSMTDNSLKINLLEGRGAC